MSIEQKIFKGVSWLAFSKVISQTYSWIITIILARILLPDDYGAIAMATILLGLASKFSQLGLGAAIIQQQNVSQEEMSSVFWFTVILGSLLTIIGFCLSYPTANIFGEPRLIPITQSISVIFILGGLQIVPLAILKKELKFKLIGMINVSGVIVSSSGMLLIAYFGGGVWALAIGRIIQSLTRVIATYSLQKWRPCFHFNFEESKKYIKFGVIIAMGGVFFYLFENSDKFFAGRAWSPEMLGYYVFALTLSQLPTEKITALINEVSYPAFCKVQDDRDSLIRVYLNITKVTATLVLPIFMGGFLAGEELVRILLDDKWLPIIFLFKFLCIAQIITSLNAVNNFVHNAQGRPNRSLYFLIACALLMSVSFYFAVQKSLNAILIPWFTTYLILCSSWIIFTLKKIGIGIIQYLLNLTMPIIATIVMSLFVVLSELAIGLLPNQFYNDLFILVVKIAVGSLIYISCLWFFDREFFNVLRNLRKGQ